MWNGTTLTYTTLKPIFIQKYIFLIVEKIKICKNKNTLYIFLQCWNNIEIYRICFVELRNICCKS